MKLDLRNPNSVVVRRRILDDKTDGGILIPETSRRHTEFADVLQVGADVIDIQIDDCVLLSEIGGYDMKLDKEDYTIVLRKEILAVVIP